MKNKLTLLFTWTISFLTATLNAQVYETKTYIKVPRGVEVTKTIKAKDCDEVVEKGAIVTSEKKKTKGKTEFTITKTDTLIADKTYQFDKDIPLKIPSLPGKANFIIDEKDNSNIRLNYWLNPKHKINNGTKIKISNRVPDCNGNYINSKDTSYTLSKDTTVYLYKAMESEQSEKWFQSSDIVIEVYQSDTISHFLVNKYDRNGVYTMKLANREFISYKNRAFEFGAIYIPIKNRFGYEQEVNGTKIQVKNDISSDVNIGIFGGYKFARYRIRLEDKKIKDLSKLGFTLGGFANISTTSIDSLSTSVSTEQLKKDEKVNIAVFSPGITGMFTFYNVQVGVFLGWDIGLGDNGKKWNYHKKPWLGFGLGYSLSSFWKK